MKGALIFRINLENKADSFAKVSNFISKLNAKEITDNITNKSIDKREI